MPIITNLSINFKNVSLNYKVSNVKNMQSKQV